MVDGEGHLVVLELKRNQTSREVVAQLLDYGSGVRSLQHEEIESLYTTQIEKYWPERKGKTLDQAFCEHFQVESQPDELNDSHKLVLVASELDDSSERIIDYLSDEYGVSINAVFFRFFRDGGREYLSRAWLIDPDRVEAKTQEKSQ